MYYTKPSLEVKSLFSPWDVAIDEEELVDVTRLLREFGTCGLDLSVALTEELWDRADALPFALLGRVTPEARIRDTVRKGVQALDRARGYFGEAFDEALGLGFGMDFAVSLPGRASDLPFQFARYYCKHGEDGRCYMTIGAPAEFSQPTEALSGLGRAEAPSSCY